MSKSQLGLSESSVDFGTLARSMGVSATSLSTAASFNKALQYALAEPGSHLIDAIVPSAFKGLTRAALHHVLGALDSLPPAPAMLIEQRIAP